jgi:hypothetical protein
MSDLSYEQEFAEVDDGPLQHCRKVSTWRLGWQGNAHRSP